MHTPAPWIVLKDSPPAVLAADGSNVAPEVCHIDDARLIAAAPDLLAALTWLLEDLRIHAPTLGPLRSIAAAHALRESLL